MNYSLQFEHLQLKFQSINDTENFGNLFIRERYMKFDYINNTNYDCTFRQGFLSINSVKQ